MRSRDQRRLTRRCRFTRGSVVLTLSILLVACTGSDEPSGTVSGTASPESVFVYAGGSGTTTINVTRSGYDGPVSFSADRLQPGVTATFNPPTLTGSALSTTMTLSVGSGVPTGPQTLDVYLLGSDSLRVGFGLLFLVGQPQIRMTLGGTGTGTVTSNPTGVNCGTTCTAAFPYGTTVTLTATPGAGSAFAGWFGGGCSGTSPTCTLAVTSAPSISATFNTTAQSYSLGISPTTATVPQGGTGTATVHIDRLNGFPGAVTLASSGAPAGLTVVANPTSTTDTTVALNLTAASSVAAGNYPIVITGTAAGYPAETVTLDVQVTAAPGGSNNISVSWANCQASEVPIWFAVQNGTGAWTRVLPGPNNSFTFAPGATGGIALALPAGTGYYTRVIYGSRAELTALALGDQCHGVEVTTGSGHLNGTMTNIGTPSAFVAVGGGSNQFPVQPGVSNSYTLDGVPAGRRDLLAVAKGMSQTGVEFAAKLILRRNVTYTGQIPPLDFGGPESFFPPTKGMFTNNVGTDQTELDVSFVTANGATPTFLTRTGTPAGISYVSMPDSLLQPGDLHIVQVLATPTGGSSYRVAAVLHHSVPQDTVTFGPAFGQPVITTLGTTPYARLRAQVASQPAYNAAVDAEFDQGDSETEVTVLAGYTGGLPATWSVEIPDLSAAGYTPAWGLKSGAVDWEMTAIGGDVLSFFGAPPVDGARIVGAGTGSSAAVSGASLRRRWVRRR